MNYQTQVIQIEGITCDACTRLITKLFSRIQGVVEVARVDKTGRAEVRVVSQLSVDQYQQALNGTAYGIIRVN